jgi:catechol 2,3-dioxygenase-like lactoylglutathione lyase family enzyme
MVDTTTAIRRHHHITLCVGTAQEDYDFHAKVLGLKSVKKTALYDRGCTDLPPVPRQRPRSGIDPRDEPSDAAIRARRTTRNEPKRSTVGQGVPSAGGETSLCGAGHSHQSAFWILEMADDESIG